jgi:hypothetical protein
MIDFTENPGFVYHAEGIPLGTYWLFGERATSNDGAELILKRVDEAEVRKAWLLSSENKVGVPNAQEVITRVLGAYPYEQVAQFTLPYGNKEIGSLGRKQNSIDVTIKVWKPLPNRP